MQQAKERLCDVDVGKGIAIFLVVLGHLVARDIKPAGNDWYLAAQIGLYSFHMAFFFYLAGYVFWAAAPQERAGRARRATARMLPAYVLLAVCGFAAKLALAPFMPVDRPIDALPGAWLALLLYPTEGFIAFLWFIVVLLSLYALTLLALRLLPGGMAWITLLALGLHAASVLGYVTKLFALHYAMVNWIFFLLAYWALRWRGALLAPLARWWPLAMLALALALAGSPEPLRWTIPPLLALPALHGLALFITARLPRLRAALSWLGERSWPIYLMNTFAIGAAKVLLLKTVGWDGPRFLLAMPILLGTGLLLPILFQRGVLARLGWLDRITR